MLSLLDIYTLDLSTCGTRSSESGFPVLPEHFESVGKLSQAEWLEKKSRFLAEAHPVQDVGEAEAILEYTRRNHPTARHVCFAYRVGFDPSQERSSDDGEPSGTAGKPILEVLQRRNLNQVLVLVIRYFGGILLGAPGLVRAYTHAACQALDASGRRRWWRCRRATAQINYSAWGKAEYQLNLSPVQIIERQFLDQVTVSLAIPVPVADGFEKTWITMGGKLAWREEKEVFVADDQLIGKMPEEVVSHDKK